MLYSSEKSVLQQIDTPALRAHGCTLLIKRDDLIDSEVSGNKWRKLKYNIAQATHLKSQGILTFGGAYSNHLIATASACHKAGIPAVGIVRGDELNQNSNETLKTCAAYGMQLEFVPRTTYDLRHDRTYKEQLNTQFPNYFQVPEGGANYYGMIGCQEIVQEIKSEFSQVFVAQGTTTTSCGLLLGLPPTALLNVVPVLKNYHSLEEMKVLLNATALEKSDIEELLLQVKIQDEFHFGGYAKYTPELLTFIQNFYQETQIPLDPIYTGKVMFALWDRLKKGELDDQTVVFVHTGGIQGAAAIQQKEGIQLYA